MNTKNNKKKGSLFDSKNLIVLGISTAVIALFAIIMTAFMPNDVANDAENLFDKSAIESSVAEKDEKTSAADSGLNAVYNEEAVTVAKQQEDSEIKSDSDNEENIQKPEVNSEQPEQNTTQNSSDAFIFPVSGAVVKDYSGDNLVYSETLKDWRTHNGIDFYAEEGTDVLAVADGTVEAITDNGMFGRTVIILHNGGVRSIYSNLAEGTEVAIGDNVTKGTPVGKVGSTAAAEALEKPHLHFEISLNEETADPHNYLPQPPEEDNE